MRVRALPALVAVPAAALVLAACGGGGTVTKAPATAAEETTAAATTSAPEESSSSASDTGGETQTQQPAEDPGAAAEGAALPDDVLDHLPAKVGNYTLEDKRPSGTDIITYSDGQGNEFNVAPTLMSSSVDDLKSMISTESTPAGTGYCGLSHAGATSPTCYLRLQTKTLNISSLHEMSVKDAVAFMNQFAKEVGTK